MNFDKIYEAHMQTEKVEWYNWIENQTEYTKKLNQQFYELFFLLTWIIRLNNRFDWIKWKEEIKHRLHIQLQLISNIVLSTNYINENLNLIDKNKNMKNWK